MKDSLRSQYFDDVYRANRDPWGFATSPYEQNKYATTLNFLPQPRFHRAFEIGCSIGVLTSQLAARCDHLLAVDVSTEALQQASGRCRDFPHVTFERMTVPQEFPADQFDLILLSEVGYYWNDEDLALAQQKIASHLNKDGHLVLVHWTPIVADYPSNGNAVHESFLGHAQFSPVRGHAEPTYRLDVLVRK